MPQPIITSSKGINIGDRIRFRAATRHDYKTAERIVVGFWAGQPKVRYHGWSDFVVQDNEIIEVIPAEKSQ